MELGIRYGPNLVTCRVPYLTPEHQVTHAMTRHPVAAYIPRNTTALSTFSSGKETLQLVVQLTSWKDSSIVFQATCAERATCVTVCGVFCVPIMAVG